MSLLTEKITNHIKSGKTYKIVFLGDSITSTEWVHPNWREAVEYALKETLSDRIENWKIPSWNIRCFNAGFDGSTTRDLLDKIDEILELKPNLIIWMNTANDLLANIGPNEHLKNSDTLITKIKSTETELLCLSSIPSYNKEYNDSYKPLVRAETSLFPRDSVLFVDLFQEYKKFNLEKFYTFISESGNKELGIEPGAIDFAHPNQLGNAYIAKVILETGFAISFDPEKFIQETLDGKMFPDF